MNMQRAMQSRAYRYHESPSMVTCTLIVHGQPVRRAIVSKAAVANMLRRGVVPAELGGFGDFVKSAASGIKRGVTKTASAVSSVSKKIARGTVDKVVKPVARAWMAVERKVRPIGMKIPVVGVFAKLHGKYVAPRMQALFGEKERAKVVAKRGTPEEKRVARKRLIKAAADVVKARQVVLAQTAKIARVEPKVLARKTTAARKRANVYRVTTPSGRTFSIPASAVN